MDVCFILFLGDYLLATLLQPPSGNAIVLDYHLPRFCFFWLKLFISLFFLQMEMKKKKEKNVYSFITSLVFYQRNYLVTSFLHFPKKSNNVVHMGYLSQNLHDFYVMRFRCHGFRTHLQHNQDVLQNLH